MNNRMKTVQNLIDSLETAVYADELLRKVYIELEDKGLEISPKLQNELDLYFGFDDSE